MVGVASLSQFTISLGGTPLTVIADPSGAKDGPGYTGGFATTESARSVVRRDVATYVKRFSRGSGFVERRDEGDDDGYAWGEDVDMWSGNGARPSGRRQNVGLGLGLGYTPNISILDAQLFNGDVWAITNHGKILQYVGANPAAVPTEGPPSGLPFNGGSTGFRAGFHAVCMAVFATAAGVPALYVACIGGGGAWRMYQYTSSGGWTESAALGLSVLDMAVTWWEGRDGTGALRLLINTGSNVVRHCIYGSDPMLAASYVTPITIGNPAYSLVKLLTAPAHAFGICQDGIWDFNELHTWNLTPYWAETADGAGGVLYDDHIYGLRGGTVDRYDLRLSGQQQRISGVCGPMAFMQDGTPIQGTVGLGGTHDGWLLGSVYNPNNKTTYIGRGKDRRTLNLDVPNPLVWHFAEQVLTPVGGTREVQLTALRVFPRTGTGTSYLWMFTTVGFSGASYDCDLYYAPLAVGSGPLSLQASGGTFSYNPTARIYHTALNWDDRNATKGMHRIDLVSRRASASATIEVKSRVDGDPTTITDQSTWTSHGSSTTNHISLSTAVTGQSIALQSVLTTPSPYTAPPLLHEISPRAHVVREALEIRYLWIVLERDHELVDGQPDMRSPDTVWTTVKALQNQATTSTFVDELRQSHQVYVEQSVQFDRIQVDEREWRTIARLEISLVS